MLTKEFIRTLTVAQLKAEIRSRGGHVLDRAHCIWYLCNFLYDLRDVEPNVVYVRPRKRRNGITKPGNAAAAPVQVVKAAVPVQVVKAAAPVQVVKAAAPVPVVQTAAPVQVVQAAVPVPVVQELEISTPPSTPIAISVFGFSPIAVKWE